MYSNRTMVMQWLNNWSYFVIEDCFSSEHRIWDEHQIYFSERLILFWSEWNFQRDGGVPRSKQSRRQRCRQDVSNADAQTDEALERRVSIDGIITFVRPLNLYVAILLLTLIRNMYLLYHCDIFIFLIHISVIYFLLCCLILFISSLNTRETVNIFESWFDY